MKAADFFLVYVFKQIQTDNKVTCLQLWQQFAVNSMLYYIPCVLSGGQAVARRGVDWLGCCCWAGLLLLLHQPGLTIVHQTHTRRLQALTVSTIADTPLL